MTNRLSPNSRLFRNAIVVATAFAIVGVMTLPRLSSAITASQTAVTSITVGSAPSGVAVSPDGSSVWVANSGNGSGNTISRINTSTNLVTDTITVGSAPVGVAISPDGSSVWVTNRGSNDGTTVSRINTSTNLVTDTITVGSAPVGVAVSPDGSSVWVTNENDDTVSRVSATAPYAVTNTITVGALPLFLAVSPDGSSVWVANSGGGIGNTISRINTSTNLVTNTITVGSGPIGVAISPDGSSVWVTNETSSSVSRIIFPPQSPSNVTATPGDAKATLSWSPPPNTGGSAITGYTATASPGGKSCTTTTATSCTITGLTNGTTYDVSVTATNAVGTSDPSASVSVTLSIPDTLAATGSDLVRLSGLVVALFGLGGGALLVSRRRKSGLTANP